MSRLTDIVCLTHNEINVTKGFLTYLEQNTDKNKFNLIFVDNGSTDGTADFLRVGQESGRWKAILLSENVGIIKARNIGAQHVVADYFLNIDNDQYVGPGWLDRLHDTMNRGYDIVGCEAWCLTPPGNKQAVVVHGTNLSATKCYYPYKRCSNQRDRYTYVGCGGMLIKKSVYERVGLFDERFSPAYFEDPDFCFTCIQSGYKIGWCYGCPVLHLAHQTVNHQKLFSRNTQFNTSWQKFTEKWYPFFPKSMGIEDSRKIW